MSPPNSSGRLAGLRRGRPGRRRGLSAPRRRADSGARALRQAALAAAQTSYQVGVLGEAFVRSARRDGRQPCRRARPRGAATTMRSGVRAPTTSRRCSRRSLWVCSRPGSAGRSCSASGTRSGGRSMSSTSRGRGDDRAGRRPAAAGRLDHPQPRQDPGHRRERARDELRLAEPCRRSRGPTRRTRKRAPRSIADLPTSTPQAEAFAKQLKSQGYRFVGPTSVYAFMQNVGVVNDHVHGCFRATDYTELQPRPDAVEDRNPAKK